MPETGQSNCKPTMMTGLKPGASRIWHAGPVYCRTCQRPLPPRSFGSLSARNGCAAHRVRGVSGLTPAAFADLSERNLRLLVWRRYWSADGPLPEVGRFQATFHSSHPDLSLLVPGAGGGAGG